MKNNIQSYLAFTTRLYRMLLFLAMPLLVIAVQLLIFRKGNLQSMITTVFLIASVEVLVDSLAFGGISSREVGGMEYLKSSAKGYRVLCTALAVNLARQLLEEIALLLICQGIASAYRGAPLFVEGEMPLFLAVVLLGYFVTVLGVVIARFFTNLAFRMCVMCLEIIPIIGIFTVLRQSYAVASALLVVLSAVAGAGGIWFTMKRGKESYYDKAA
ncbi:MAG: hypothetical protein ACLT3H_06230 [Roseburia sp.]